MSPFNIFKLFKKPRRADWGITDATSIQDAVRRMQNELIAELDGEDELWRSECLSDDTRVCPATIKRTRTARQE
jgi:hypothetical protein